MSSRTWSLRTRLTVSVVAVATVAVLSVTIAALLGTQRGFSAAEATDRQRTADQVAAVAASAYVAAGGWAEADLADAERIAQAAGARLILRFDVEQASGGQGGSGQNGGGQNGGGQGAVSAPVIVDDQVVAMVRLVFRQPDTAAGRGIAWTWIAVAAAGALIVALSLAWWLSTRLTAPLTGLARTVRAFGSGDRDARAPREAPGEIGDLARAFDDMADSLQYTEATRRAMAHDVAHELRTPLAALQAGLEELRDGLEPAEPARLAALHDQSLRIGRIVDDLGQLAEAEASADVIQTRAIDLAALTRSGVTAAQGLLDSAGLTVECICPEAVAVIADPDRVQQILTNLISNAARYCEPGDSVSVSVYRETDAGVLRVHDTGPGMTEADAQRAFDRFHRGAAAGVVPGSGLGLAIVRALTEAQGGSAELSTSLGSGTTVSIRLPAQTGQGSAQHPGNRSSTS